MTSSSPSVGTLTLASLAFPATQITTHIAYKYSLGIAPHPVISFRTQQIPIFVAVTQTYVIEAWMKHAIKHLMDPAADRHANLQGGGDGACADCPLQLFGEVGSSGLVDFWFELHLSASFLSPICLFLLPNRDSATMYPVLKMSGKGLLGVTLATLAGPPSATIKHYNQHECDEGMKKVYNATPIFTATPSDAFFLLECDHCGDHAHTLYPPLRISTSTARTPSTHLGGSVDVRKYGENEERRRDETRDGAWMGKEWGDGGFILKLHWAGRITTFGLKPAIDAWLGRTGAKTTSPDGRDGYPFRKIEVGVAAVSELNAILTLLTYPVILPKTIPVGVSNVLMFSAKGHLFYAQLIYNLATFDRSWFLNYSTNMFSTGPMFLSIHSWHADGAAFIGFLGHWGNNTMLAAVVVLVAGVVFMVLPIRQRRQVMRLMGGLSSRWVHDSLLGDRTNDRQRGVLFFLPVSIRPHGNELNPSLKEMRLEKCRHVQEPEDSGPGEY
ncbi:hypothetical protein ARMGADRAFT_1025127 [Armillaria gallica]|uniref:Uncharacterized protein n=1 Tax=Armillaria gallica TaxID=47427 RepID=A0A2H3ERH1_ARMGA|nr:hypothetical protein ARMGADRAFT_1025127 [Armillaria gallica]